MRACWAATILVLAQPSPVFCATYRGTSVVPRVLELTHRRPHKSPCVRQPFVETSGSIAFSSLCSFPGNCALFLCVSSRVHSSHEEGEVFLTALVEGGAMVLIFGIYLIGSFFPFKESFFFHIVHGIPRCSVKEVPCSYLPCY